MVSNGVGGLLVFVLQSFLRLLASDAVLRRWFCVAATGRPA